MRRRRILLLEDNEAVRDAVSMMLQADNHEVLAASNRTEALRLLEQGSYDAIVSDLRIPNLDGPTLYREVKQRQPEAVRRLIFMTGHTPEYAGFFEETGVHVLSKPFTVEALREAVQRALVAR